MPVVFVAAIATVVATVLAMAAMISVVATVVAVTIPAATTPLRIRVVMFIAVADPLLLHEINRLSASTVPPAIIAPVLLMLGWYVEVDRLALFHIWLWRNHDWPLHNDRRGRKIADIDAPVDARLRNPDGDTDLCARDRGGCT